MKISNAEIEADRRKMVAYIGPRVSEDGQQIILASGRDGEAWVELFAAFDEELGWDLHFTTNEPEWVTLREIFDHFRRQDMTSWEWARQLAGEIVLSRARELERLLADAENRQVEEGFQQTAGRRTPSHDLQRAEYLAVKDAAVVSSLSESYLRRKIYSRELPATNIGSEARPVWRISRKDLAQWMEARKGGTPSIPPKSKLRDLIQRHLPGL